MSENEIQKSFGEIKKQIIELIFIAIDGKSLSPSIVKNLAMEIAKMPIKIKDAIFWNKFYLFLSGVNEIQNNNSKAIRLSDKLFGNENKKQENGMRLLSYIDKAESEEKVQYMINATRSLLLNLICLEDYFRIIRAIVETLNEDIVYFSKIAESTDIIKGNINILALSRSGLVIQAGIDGNESVEKQDYVITDFGRMVDRYAISLENDERQRFYKTNQFKSANLDLQIGAISEDEINALFDD